MNPAELGDSEQWKELTFPECPLRLVMSITYLNPPAFESRCYYLHCELCIVPEIEIWRKASSPRLQLHWGGDKPRLA